MVTNKIYVNNQGAGRNDVLSEMDRFSDYLELSHKSKLHIRLLTEELLGMVAEIGGDFDAEFWAENEGDVCRLFLEAELSKMSLEKREALIGVSTSGRNAAETGFMSKLKSIFELYWLGCKYGIENSGGFDYSPYLGVSGSSLSAPIAPVDWRLADYRGEIAQKKDSERVAEWDELEKSIVANIADDISVSVKGETVEFVITKTV